MVGVLCRAPQDSSKRCCIGGGGGGSVCPSLFPSPSHPAAAPVVGERRREPRLVKRRHDVEAEQRRQQRAGARHERRDEAVHAKRCWRWWGRGEGN